MKYIIVKGSKSETVATLPEDNFRSCHQMPDGTRRLNTLTDILIYATQPTVYLRDLVENTTQQII